MASTSTSTSTATATISLTPSAGFCVKSAIISTKTKVFVNIAYDAQVPPPQKPSDDYTTWFVPVVVSDGRKDIDKAGSPCLVFDCVYNTSIKSRILRDTDGEFKIFIIELSLQRIESQSNDAILLSRQIKTPNILSKGRLDKRIVTIPTSLLVSPAPSTSPTSASAPTKKLIEELPSQTNPKKGILKKASHDHVDSSQVRSSPTSLLTDTAAQPIGEGSSKLLNHPAWSWSIGPPASGDAEKGSAGGGDIKITILVPSLTYDHIDQADLSLSSTRIRLHIPSLYYIDIDLELSDAEIIFKFSGDSSAGGDYSTSISASDILSLSSTSGEPTSNANEEIKQLLSLKRHVRSRSSSEPVPPSKWLDVDTAHAEWLVNKGVLVVYA